MERFRASAHHARDRELELLARDRGKLYAGAGAARERHLVCVDHRVGEAAHAGNDGDRAVTESDQLREAAGLEARRHQQRVDPALDPVGEGLVVPERDGDAPRVLARRGRERVLERRVSGAEDGELRASAKQLGQRRDEHVDAFLPREPAHDAEYERAWLDGQAEVRLQRRLVGCALVQPMRIVARGEVRVRRGVPHRHVDPVENAGQAIGALAQEAVEPHPRLGRPDFRGIGR